MPRKKNTLAQFTANDNYNTLYLEIPGPLKLFKYFLILLVISPWIFVLLYRIDINSSFKGLIGRIFGINQGENKKANGFL